MRSQRYSNLFRKSAINILIVMLCACSADTVSAENRPPLELDVGDRPRAISVADLNGDSRPDIAVANANTATMTILLQQKSSSDFLRVDYPAGNEPSDIELGDFDRDGDLDAAIANHETSFVTVLLNDGSGAFVDAAGSPFETGARPHLHGLAVGDFDGDGWLDIAADSSDRDVVTVLRGSSEGFRLGEPLGAGSFPYYRIDAYAAQDGSDILVPSPRAHRVSQISPRRSSSDQQTIVGDARGAMMAISADLNGDAFADVAAVVEGAVALWTAGDGSFLALPETPVAFDVPTEIAAGDINGDGLDEIVVGLWDDSKIYVLSPKGEPMGSMIACFRPVALAVSDLNSDGNAEIIAGCWNEKKIMIFEQTNIHPARKK